jgi:hypothetical protein
MPVRVTQAMMSGCGGLFGVSHPTVSRLAADRIDGEHQAISPIGVRLY